MSEIKNFTNMAKAPDIEFQIDDDVFVAVGTAPAMAVLDVSAVGAAEGVDRLRIVFEFLDQVLKPESAQRFAERMRSADEPITVDQAAAVAVWLMEEHYAPERPTEAQSSSAGGPGTTGQSSTDGAQPAASTRVI